MHAPSACRALLRRLKEGDDPRGLLAEAKRLPDPSWAATALLAISADRRLMWEEASKGLDAALEQALQVERLGRRAELWGQLLKDIPHWREGARNPQAGRARRDFTEAAVADLEAMPDGQWTHDGVTAAAPHVLPADRLRLLERALRNPGFEAEGAKAVLAAADVEKEPALLDRARAIQDPDVRRRVLGHLEHHGAGTAEDAVAAAWQVQDAAARQEALRALAWNATDVASLDVLADSVLGRAPEDTTRTLIACAARADRLGDPDRMRAWLDAAGAHATSIKDDRRRGKVAKKLVQARERAGLDTKTAVSLLADAPTPAPRPVAAPASADDMAPSSGHVLALVAGYGGGLAPPHLRAAGRGAALCAAFGHDLWLVGFPSSDLDGLVSAAARETEIGEQAGYLERLHAAGRVRLLDAVEVPSAWPGLTIATTPHPRPGKETDLAEAKGPVCLLVGLGRQGIPDAVLDRVEAHYELTGRGVSLETATALGILADRLSTVPK